MFIVRGKHDGSLYEVDKIQDSRVLQGRSFVCPVCGEDVISVSGDGNPFHFYRHKKKTHNTPFCEIRVSNICAFRRIDEKSVRVMLRGGGGKFELVALFPSISEKYSKYGSSYLRIETIPRKSYRIDRFIGRKSQIVLNFIPSGDNSRISLDSILFPLYSEIGRRIDYFVNGCALFDGNSMKKIPENGVVCSTYEYRLVCSNPSVSIPLSFNPQLFGELTAGSTPIYSIVIPANCNSDDLSFLNYCGVCLEDPTVCPDLLWPPASNVDGIQNVCMDSNLIFRVKSTVTEAWEDQTGLDLGSCNNYRIGRIAGDETIFSFKSGKAIHSICGSVNNPPVELQSRFVYLEHNEGKGQVEVNFKGYVLSIFRNHIRCYKQDGKTLELKEPYETLLYFDDNLKEFFRTDVELESEATIPSRSDYISRRMIPLPSWFRCSVLAMAKNHPAHARMILSTISDGLVSESVVKIMQQWR